jgi:hypothetical protein
MQEVRVIITRVVDQCQWLAREGRLGSPSEQSAFAFVGDPEGADMSFEWDESDVVLLNCRRVSVSGIST